MLVLLFVEFRDAHLSYMTVFVYPQSTNPDGIECICTVWLSDAALRLSPQPVRAPDTSSHSAAPRPYPSLTPESLINRHSGNSKAARSVTGSGQVHVGSDQGRMRRGFILRSPQAQLRVRFELVWDQVIS